MKTIIVFKGGEFLKLIKYPSKKLAKANLNVFKKHGIIDPNTGELIPNTQFEII